MREQIILLEKELQKTTWEWNKERVSHEQVYIYLDR